MSKRSEQTQLNIRPYKIEVYGLQDNYISTLQSYTDSFLGRVIEPKVKLMDDGTQTFTCKIPKFYIDPKTNQKIINPRWENEASVILAENTHVLKVFIQQGDSLKVFPFIVDKITDRRDSHFSVFKEVEANGLAFSDLGKVGYKLELNSHTLESDYKKDKTIVATIDYWLDKVFPNTKDSNGNIISWDTPWCYEIKMDWSYFSSERDSTKVYENSYTGSWIYDPNISPTELIPNGTVEGKEKARYINCVNSNKYNITQTIAETFEVFCRYEYACESNGKFVKEYTDENGKVWTGKKVVFYNKAIKTENPLVIDYQKNLDTITRSADSTDIYTKLFVVPVESTAMNDGYVTIASTQANPILDDFILNFDYLDSVGSISDYQKQFINEYKIQMRLINQELISLGEDIEVSTVDLNTLEAQSAFIEAQRSSLNEQLDYYQGLRDNEVINTPVTRGKDNSYSVVFVKDNVTGNLTASFHGLEGIDSSTIKGYKDFTYEEEKLLFDSVEVASSISEVTKNDVVYALLGEDGFPASLAAKDGGKDGKISLGTVYIGLTYLPKNKYDKLVNSAQSLVYQSAAELNDYKNEETGKIILAKAALEEKEQLYNDKLLEKAKLNEKLERILGPALREGNWQADNYEDPKDGIVTITGNGYEIENNVEFIFDQEPFENEQKAYVLVSGAPYGQDKYYFHYLKAEDFSFENNRLEDLTIRLRRDFTYTVQNTNEEFLKREFLRIDVPFKGQKIERYVKLTSSLKIGDKILLNYRGNTNNLYINGKLQNWYESEIPNPNQVWDITQVLAYYKEDGEIYESLESSSGEYFLYYGSGFKPAFYNISGANIPVLLIVGNSLLDINDKTFDYEKYNFISYSFIGKSEVYDIGSLEENLIKPNEEKDILVYPRIYINAENVQYNSDLMTLKLTDAIKEEESVKAPQLKKFEDYMVLSRKGQAYITLKVTQNNTFDYILSGPYRLDYQISHANEMLYLDAIQVAKDNSHPRYSYELKLANLPHEFAHVGLSEMVYINDHAMGIHAATGYISEVEYDLDEPWNDDIVIQNYKTKFEDLFHTITAQSEAMRKNSPKYDIAASGFTPNGSIAGSVLQQSLNNTQVYLDYSGTGVQITPQDGIILTNTQPYLNGVYGQIKLQGGGIFISSSVDENGNRIWSSSITPLGINANLLTAGQINTENIRIYSGDNMAFQWNPEGIFAYKNIEGELSPNVYVKYSQHGLHYIDETLEWDDSNLVNGKQSLVSLNWDGLKLKNRSGENTFFADMDGNLTLRGTLKSYDYHEGESRLLSTGWKIEAGGYAEFNDLFVRGTISASVFEYEETSAVGGRLLVSPTFILKSEHTTQAQISMETDSPLNIVVPIGVSIENNSFSAGGRNWEKDNVIIFNGKFINKDALEKIKQGKDVSNYPIYEIKQLQMKINSLDANNQTITLTSIAMVDGLTQNLFYGPDGNIVNAEEAIKNLGGLEGATGTGDWHLISFGTDGAKEGILLTAIEPDSGSYIDILGKGTDVLSGSTRVRLGDLSSLAANKELIEALGSTPSGWGLYADNVFLRGAIYATSGRIGSLSIDEVEEIPGTIGGVSDTINEITTTKNGKVIINKGAITADSIEVGLIQGQHIESNTITAENIKSNTITVNQLASNVGENLEISSNESIITIGNTIKTQAESIQTNAKAIATQAETINTQAISIQTNAKNIETNANNININASNIELNSNSIKANTETLELKVGKDGVVAAINASQEGLTIKANKISLEGLVTANNYFKINTDGSVEATSGKIGGWTIGTDRLYAGSGTEYVALSTKSEAASDGNVYRIWAGNSDITKAPFRVTNDGRVYLTRVMALTNEDDDTPTEVDLSRSWYKVNYGLTDVTATTGSDGTVTLVFTRTGGKSLSVNFKRATTGILVAGGGNGSPSFTVSYIEGYQGAGTGTTIASSQVVLALSNAPYNALSSVTASFGNQGSQAMVPVGPVYNAGWMAAGSAIKHNGGSSTSFTVTVPSSTIGGQTTSETYTMAKGSTPSADQGYASVLYKGTLMARIDITDWYKAGYEAGKAAMGLSRDGNVITVVESETKSITASLKDTHYVQKGSQTNLIPGQMFTGTAGAYYYGQNIGLGGDSWIEWT